MECYICDNEVTNGVECGGCKKKLHFDCANMPAARWAKLGVARQVRWKCIPCRIPPGRYQNQVRVILQSVNGLKQHFLELPKIYESLRHLNQNLEGMKAAAAGDTYVAQSLQRQHSRLDKRISGLLKLGDFVTSLDGYVQRVCYLITKTPPAQIHYYDTILKKIMQASDDVFTTLHFHEFTTMRQAIGGVNLGGMTTGQ